MECQFPHTGHSPDSRFKPIPEVGGVVGQTKMRSVLSRILRSYKDTPQSMVAKKDAQASGNTSEPKSQPSARSVSREVRKKGSCNMRS